MLIKNIILFLLSGVSVCLVSGDIVFAGPPKFFGKSHVKRRKFSQEEDERLVRLVNQFGTSNWEEIAINMGNNRNVRQCRERWKHYLCLVNPSRPFTPEEDDLIFEKVQELGAKWTKISCLLMDRSDLQIKNRWYSHLQYRISRVGVTKLHSQRRYLVPVSTGSSTEVKEKMQQNNNTEDTEGHNGNADEPENSEYERQDFQQFSYLNFENIWEPWGEFE